MTRTFDLEAFDRAYAEHVVATTWQEPADYYPRYRTRYAALLELYARQVAPEPIDTLEVGGGQLAMLAKAMWGDRAVVADIAGPQFPYLNEQGVETALWNLCSDDQPFHERFDVVFFSEVIEHLPVPGHLALEKLRRALRPGGRLICSTPNLYRPRNVVYLALGRPVFDYFHVPTDHALGHVLEYSADHLRFQIERAGFLDGRIELRHFAHAPTRLGARLLAWLGAPLYQVPRFRDNLLATAIAP
ncbi:MAG: methyltransferase domain-containing protein [Polyangiaceae bacterium]